MDSRTLTILLIILASLVVVLLVVCIVLYCIYLRRNRRARDAYRELNDDGIDHHPPRTASSTPGGVLPAFLQEQKDLPAYVVVKPFVPKRRDDMKLEVGDMVTISMVFTDGNVHGFSHSSLSMGVFPLSCLGPAPGQPQRPSLLKRATDSMTTLVNTTPAAPANTPQQPPPPRQRQHEKVMFSMVTPETALDLVAETLTPERRAHYFESLLRDTLASPTPTSSPSVNPLESQLRASMEGAAGSESRSKQAWRKLRVGWKDAVRKELDQGYDKWMEARRDRFDIWQLMAENYGTSGWGTPTATPSESPVESPAVEETDDPITNRTPTGQP
ncbi:hypothetical protein DFJ77DRAFT_542709 [Powellomyces hirtus]|nr:hypothetical protein DFJ77DRAFT_542709 [Powellomyces hirtus]